MFTERSLSPTLAAVRETHAPEAFVLDCERDFETLQPAVAEELGLLVDELDPTTYPAEWLPADAPDINAVQGDSATFSLTFGAVQCRHNMANVNPFTGVGRPAP